MPQFTITGDFDPFLHVSFQKGEWIFTESDAMVSMDATLELKGEMRGGFFSAVARRLTSGESFFQTRIEAVRGPGDALLAPGLPGSLEILDIGREQYHLNDGAFLAATSGVELHIQSQGIGQGLFGGTGGFFVMVTGGAGKLAISGFGSTFSLDVHPGNDVIIDNYHVLAWSSGLTYHLSMPGANRGILGGLVSGITTGEGIVNRFSGNGKVIVCSRNRNVLLQWIQAHMPSAHR